MKNSVNVVVKTGLVWHVFQGPTEAWVGVCDALGLTVSGDSKPDLFATAAEAVQLLFQDLIASDELEDFLRQQGWRLSRQLPPHELAEADFCLPMTFEPNDGRPTRAFN